MHYINTRPDPLSVAFTKKLLCESHFGMWSTLETLIISQPLFGFTTWLGKLVKLGEETLDSTTGIQVLMFDRVMEKYVDEKEVFYTNNNLVFLPHEHTVSITALNAERCRIYQIIGDK